jgi:hypothetical protein
LLELRFFTMGAIFIKKQTVQWVLVTLLHMHCLEIFCNKVWVIDSSTKDEELMNSSLLWWCPWQSLIFTSPLMCYSGISWGTPVIQKLEITTPLSNDTHVVWHWSNLLKYDAEGMH